MKIVKPEVQLIWVTSEPLKTIEQAGRVAYKSEDKISAESSESAEKFVKMLLKRGHESVIEHACASLYIVTDRGVSHEFVRHRLFSYTQESTRYCDYNKDKFDGQISVVTPLGLTEDQYDSWKYSAEASETAYKDMRKLGAPAEVARDVLPTCLKTELFVTGNFREWRHFLKTRLARGAHPKMREVARLVLAVLQDACPVVFDEFLPLVSEETKQ